MRADVGTPPVAPAPRGRIPETRSLLRFLEGIQDPASTRVMLVSGEAGIGKTVLWWWAIEEARRRGVTTLVARPTGAGAMAFEGIGDLLADADPSLDGLSEPLRTALDAAIPSTANRPRGSVTTINEGRVTRACLEAIRSLARPGPVLVAIDDIPYLDPESRRIVEQMPRRLGHSGVAVLATVRVELAGISTEKPGEADRWTESPDVVSVGPLPDEALAEAIAARRGIALPRPVLRKVLTVARGNPMLAIELTRSLDCGETTIEIDGLVGVPLTLRRVVAARLENLPEPVRQLLQVVSETSAPTPDVVAYVLGEAATETIEAAVDLGVVDSSEGRLAVTHPLLASGTRATTSPALRREIHIRLAELATDVEQRAFHLGMAATAPNSLVATLLAEASCVAWARGAADAAAAFAEHAVRLTPADDTQRVHRVLAAADLMFESGDATRSIRLVESTLDLDQPNDGRNIGAGAARSPLSSDDRAALLLRLGSAKGVTAGFRVGAGVLRAALEQLPSARTADFPESPAPDHARAVLRGRVLLERSSALAQFDARAALPVCLEAVDEARNGQDHDLSLDAADHLASLHTLLIHPDAVRQMSVDLAVAHASSQTAPAAGRLPSPRQLHRELGVATRLRSAGHLDAARIMLFQLRARLEREGGEGALPAPLLQLTEIECFAGRLEQADHIVGQCREVMIRSAQAGMRAQLDYLDAFRAALRGQPDEAAHAATAALKGGVALQDGRHQARAARILGQLALARSDWATAASTLNPAVQLAAACGFCEPGFLRLDGDAVESLAGSGDVDGARRLSADLDARAQLPWARALAAYARAIVHAADGRLADAQDEAMAATQQFAALGHPVDSARALILHAGIARRQRHRAISRQLLDTAARLLDNGGVQLWNERITAQRLLLGTTATQPGALTPAEERVALAVSRGLTNRQIAADLHISIKTVEANLSRIYRKLGLRSRSELVAVILRAPAQASAPNVARYEQDAV